MAILRLEDGTTYTQLSDIGRELAPLNIQLNRWSIGEPKLRAMLAQDVLSDAEKEYVLKALDIYFQQLQQTAGYQFRDLIVLHPDIPNLDAMLSKFEQCHTHADAEVRYIIAGAICAAPDYGIAYSVVLGTLMAHAGADAVLYPAHYGNLPFDPVEETRIRDALRTRNVMPVPSAGIHPGIVPKALADYGQDVILNAGTGIMDHPDGPAAGVQAFFEALERVAQNESFELEALPSGALHRAVEKWGKRGQGVAEADNLS